MMKRTKHKLSNRGSLALLAGLLLASSVLRVALGASSALADVDLTEGLVLPLGAQPADPEQNASDDTDIRPLLDALRSREEQVLQREDALAARQKALDVAQHEVQRRLLALENAEQRLRDTLSIAQTAAEDDLTNLTTVYESMKPKEASALFEAMEPAFAAGFLGRMRPDAAAKIMAGLDPQAAYSISAILAGRNARAPKD
ncbi:MAG: hypothetical protein AAFQ58_07840 [Pseudomonadota bacterium]